MRRGKLLMITIGLALPLTLTTIRSAAQRGDDKGMDDTAIARSRAIQAAVAQIEENPGLFADQLVASWEPYLDGRYGDLREELRDLLARATPWRMYAASLVGDFRGMLQVL